MIISGKGDSDRVHPTNSLANGDGYGDGETMGRGRGHNSGNNGNGYGTGETHTNEQNRRGYLGTVGLFHSQLVATNNTFAGKLTALRVKL